MMKLVVVFAILFIAGCSQQGDSVVHHPTEENLDMSAQTHSAILYIPDEVSEEESDFGSSHHFQVLDEVHEVSMIGIQYGNEEEMFGRIEDAVISGNYVYLLDSNSQDIRVFTVDGEYIATTGGRGEGPGELQMATSLAVYQDKWLHVSNGYRMEVYDITEEIPEYMETIEFSNMIHSMCISEDKLYLHSVQPLGAEDIVEGENYIHTLHAHSIPSYERLFSFGESYRHEDFSAIGRLSMGRLDCGDVSDLVLFTFERMPVFHGYSTGNGDLKWKSRIEGLHFPNITETNEGGRSGFTYSMPEGNVVDQLSSPMGLGVAHHIVQIIRANVPEIGTVMSEDRNVEVHTFAVNNTSGNAVYLGNHLPEVVFVSDRFMISRDLFDGYTTSRVYEFDADLIP